MRILTFIPTYGRPAVTKLCFDGLLRAYRSAPAFMKFETLIIASDKEGEAMARKYGFNVRFVANKPLGRKFNTGLSYALKDFDFDYLFQINSDNLLRVDFWAHFEEFLAAQSPFFGVANLAFYDAATGRAVSHLYADGCGIRFIRRDVLEASAYCVDVVPFVSMSGNHRFNVQAGQRCIIPAGRYKPNQYERIGPKFIQLWEPKKNSGLDINSAWQIYKGSPAAWPIKFPLAKFPLVVDIKTAENIHPFSEFQTDGENLDVADLLRSFPELGTLAENTAI